MPTTRSQSAEMEDPRAALKHFRCNVMGEAEDQGRLLNAFQSLVIETIVEFLILQKEDYEDALVNNNNDATSKLTKLEVRKILKAQEWFHTHPDNKGIPTWFELDTESFNSYLISGHKAVQPSANDSTLNPPQSPSATASNLALEFTKGVKRDVTQYKEFSESR